MVRWYSIRGLRCPAKECKGRNQSHDWTCKSCRTSIYIAETGELSCYDDTHIGPIIEWEFNCGNHGHHPVKSYRPADFQGLTYALSMAAQLMDEAGATWYGALCVQLGKQYGARRTNILQKKRHEFHKNDGSIRAFMRVPTSMENVGEDLNISVIKGNSVSSF